MEEPKPTEQHTWLQQLIGEWRFESEAQMEPGSAPVKTKGGEVVRSLGGLWTVGEGYGGMPDGGECKTLMTLGFDPRLQRFVGTFVVSIMTHLWPYSGTLDESGKILTLDSEGPGFDPAAGLSKYQDIIQFVSRDHRSLSSRVLGKDGKWVDFMKADYYRTA